jgi:hypothetical protein
MGTSTIYDIISSLFIFGLLLLATLRLNASASESNYAYNQNYLLQRNMVVLTAMLEDDLKHVGIGTINQNGGIIHADSDDLRFYSDLHQSGIPNIVEWRYESAVSGIVPNLQNTRIHYLDRIVDGVTNRMNLGVTTFRLSYWNVYDDNLPIVPLPIDSNSTPNTGNIGPVSVMIRLESSFRLKQQYTESTDTSAYQMVWRQLRSISRNNAIQFQ